MRSRFFVSLTAALLCAALLAASASALTSTTVTWIRTTERGATLRSSPEAPEDNRNKIMSIRQFEYIQVLGKEGDWYYVYYNGRYGYVTANSRWVQIVSEPDTLGAEGIDYYSTAVTLIRTTERGVSLRWSPEAPKDNSNLILIIHQFEEIQVLGAMRGWYYVYYDGHYGYVSASPLYVTVVR